LKATDMHQHFLSIAEWVDPADTVDRIIIGDPETEVRRVLVTWMSTFDAVRAAATRGCQMLITHEPTFWVHRDELANVERWPDGSPKRELALRKRRFIEQNGLVILRIHDVWDRMPEIGIPWAWARFLGLGTSPAAIGAEGYQHRYDVDPLTLEALARLIAARTATLGEPWVQVVGDGGREVSRVGIGTGCGCDIATYLDMGCDCSVVCDDGSSYWKGIQMAKDMGHPVIRVNHGTSEEPGMVSLAEYINGGIPGLAATHLPHGCSFRLVE